MIDISNDLLVVSEADNPPSVDGAAHYVGYHYTSQTSPTCMSAWESSKNSNLYWVSEDCRAIKACFSQQALNYPVAKVLSRGLYHTLLVSGLSGATIDLVNVAKLLGLSVYFFLHEDDLGHLYDAHFDDQRWVYHCLAQCDGVFWPEARVTENREALDKYTINLIFKRNSIVLPKVDVTRRNQFDYTVYELILRDHPLLFRMQEPDTRHFVECQNVLDIGCGAGIFLDALRCHGIAASGVERNRDLVAHGESMGLRIQCADALEYLGSSSDYYDGIYCSHFVEHLPVDAVEHLLQGLSERLLPGGVLVLVFPDPESIRSQLLGFWRDPEHVRFYHPELIQTMALAYDLDCEWSSYEDVPHEVASFSITPPEWKLPERPVIKRRGLWSWLLKKMGVATVFDLTDANEELNQLRYASELLRDRTEKLWAVNRTWAWEDNVVLKLRKRGPKTAC